MYISKYIEIIRNIDFMNAAYHILPFASFREFGDCRPEVHDVMHHGFVAAGYHLSVLPSAILTPTLDRKQ